MSMADQDVLFIFKKTHGIQNEHMGLNNLRKIWNLKLSYVFPLSLHLVVFAKVLQISKFLRQQSLFFFWNARLT